MSDELKMMVNNIGEQELLLSYLKPEMSVLEFGAGASTLAIAPLVKELVSIEHNSQWYNDLMVQIPSNVKLIHIPANQEPSPEYDDGTYSDFENYIDYPLNNFSEKKFDVVFIDGRARVECARVALKLLKEDGVIFIHDYRHPQEEYRRYEYECIEDYYEVIEGSFAMWKLKPKK